MSTPRPATCPSPCEPGIYFDEVHCHRVGITRGQHERLLDVVSAAFDIVAATDIPELATSSDFAAVPALKIVRVAESYVNRERCYKWNLTKEKASAEKHMYLVSQETGCR